MQQLVLAVAALGFMLSISYIFIKSLQTVGPSRAFILTLMLADLFLIMLMLLGLDRPWKTLYLRGKPAWTITYLQLFLVVKIPITAWATWNRERLREVLGG